MAGLSVNYLMIKHAIAISCAKPETVICIYRESANIFSANPLLHLLPNIEIQHFDQFLQYIPNHLLTNLRQDSLALHTPRIPQHIQKKSPLQARRICVSPRGMSCVSHCTYSKVGYWRDCGLIYLNPSGLMGVSRLPLYLVWKYYIGQIYILTSVKQSTS